MDFIIIILSLILSAIFYGELVSKLLMLLTFINIMCTFFGQYIPLSSIILEVTKFGSVMTMIVLGIGFILVSGSNKKDNTENN